MDRDTMSGVSGASDAELKKWLGEVCPVVVRALKLPQPLEKTADRALETVSVGTALRWVEMLGIEGKDKIRFMAQSVPDAAAKLSSQEGQRAIRSWEATHRVIPVLSSLERAVKTLLAFWRTGGHPRRGVIRTLAAVSASQVVPGAAEFREEVAAAIGGSESSAVCLIADYAANAMTNEVEKIEGIDSLISRKPLIGPWVRSLWVCLKLKAPGIKQESNTGDESSHPLWRLSLILREAAGRKGKENLGNIKDSELVM
ncbi:hypothetical protein ACFLXC_01540 [Chloroflexota bacterium]